MFVRRDWQPDQSERQRADLRRGRPADDAGARLRRQRQRASGQRGAGVLRLREPPGPARHQGLHRLQLRRRRQPPGREHPAVGAGGGADGGGFGDDHGVPGGPDSNLCAGGAGEQRGLLAHALRVRGRPAADGGDGRRVVLLPVRRAGQHAGSTANSFLFQGQQYDAASGTYYLRARYYDQNNGRFLSQDPFGGSNDDPISLHRYLYANDDPANNVDPSGEETLCELSVSLGINTSLTASVFTIANRVYGAATTLSDAADLYYDWEATGTVDTGDVVNLAFDVVMPKLGPMLFKGLFGRWLCFTAGTSVAMADGSKKPIEKIEVGDLVFSRDEATGETQAKRVLQTFEHQVSETLVLHFRGGATVETTPNHPFYVDGKGFVPACQLGIGNSIITRAGPSAVLDSIEYRYKVVTVYNFEVEGFHTYFVGQDALWVHNHCTPLANWVSTQTKDTGNNATLLRKSLKGIIQAGEEAHHIVARTHRRADRARKLLDKFQIDINGAENGVGLVNNMHHGQGLHSFSGIDTVYDRLFAAQQGVKNWGKARAEIIFELQKIGAEQRAGTFQP